MTSRPWLQMDHSGVNPQSKCPYIGAPDGRRPRNSFNCASACGIINHLYIEMHHVPLSIAISQFSVNIFQHFLLKYIQFL